MRRWHLPLLGIKKISSSIMEITLSTKGQSFEFKAGQSVSIAIEGERDREFSILSSPKTKETISFAFRRTGSYFKEKLLSTPIGRSVEIKGPNAMFLLPEEQRDLVFVAGGIGVTPFLSMMSYALEEKLPHDITLLYINKEEEEPAYKERVLTFIQEEKVFFLTRDKVVKSLEEIHKKKDKAIWYVAGGVDFVQEVKKKLFFCGVKERDIHLEEFKGY